MRRICRSFFIATVLLTASTPPLAQTAATGPGQAYPVKPVRLVVPFTPGGSTDIVARIVGQKLDEAWKQQVIIDNRPGAGGTVGVDFVAKSAPDGYTLVMGHVGTFGFGPSLYSRLPYDSVRDFAPITLFANVPNMLVVNPSLPVKSVKELIALGKARPGQLNYGSAGSFQIKLAKRFTNHRNNIS